MTLDDKNTHIELKLGTAVATTEFSCVATWTEPNVYGGGKKTGASNGMTAIKLIEGPYQGEDVISTREVRTISITNTDTMPNDVTIQYNDQGTEREIYTAYLQPKTTLFYDKNHGWLIMDKFGNTPSPVNTDEMIYFVCSGTDAYTASTPKITALYEGLTFKFKIPNNNTGAATLNINGLGAKDLRNFGATALSADELEAGTIYEATYDGANFQISSTTDRIQNNV